MKLFFPPSTPDVRWIVMPFRQVRMGGTFRYDKHFWVKLNAGTARKKYNEANFGEVTFVNEIEPIMTVLEETKFAYKNCMSPMSV